MPSQRKRSGESLFSRCCGHGNSDEKPTNGRGEGTEPPVPIDMTGGEYEKIKQQCLSSGTLYEDPDFVPDSDLLFQGGYVAGVLWQRPKEISTHPKYIHGDADYYDMHQGEIGNCWFVAAVACLTASPQKQILTRVIPTDQSFGKDYCGAFRFHFWRYGRWIEVVVDDRLPTYRGQLLYSSNTSQPDEYWCPLLEKAYAKLNGNYDIIDGGRIHTALVDLTSGIGEMVGLKTSITSDELKDILINCQHMNSIMGGAIYQTEFASRREIRLDNGLYQGHAYSVLQVKEVRTQGTSTTILHLRNPWGKGEWNGAWSDRSKEWYSLSEEDRKKTFSTRDDGEFWISIDDFRSNFDELELCHLSPDGLTKEIAANLDRSQWNITEHHGAWVKGATAGGPLHSFTSPQFWTNPQFKLQLALANKPTTVVVSLLQLQTEVDDINIGFVIFKLAKGRQPIRITADNFYEFNPRLDKTSGAFWPYRERTLRFVMEPYDYVIVPCTFKADQEAEFYMRVFSEDKVIAGPTDVPLETGTDDVVTIETRSNAQIIAEEEFDRYGGSEGLISAEEMVLVLNKAMASEDKELKSLTLETCRCLLGLNNFKRDKGVVSKKDFKKIWTDLKLWREAFHKIDANKSGSLDKAELKELFKIIDIGNSDNVIDAIFKRYGGKQGRVREEDFLQSFCRTIQLFRAYREIERSKRTGLMLNEWIEIGLKC